MGMTTGGKPRGGQSWPTLVALGAAFLMVFVILPNPFRIPSNDPSTAAEYAPVPGKKDSSSRAGSFSAVGFAEGAGLGGAAAPPPSPPPLPAGGGPNNKKGRPAINDCVVIDGVPHQTWDPLSPPCVPTYDPSQKRSNAQGVTDDEVRVVLYTDYDIRNGEDLTAPYDPSQESNCAREFECRNLMRTAKAQLRYHQNRYQTYGRRVRVVVYKAPAGGQSTDTQRKGDALTIARDYKPFAVVYAGDKAGSFWDALAAQKIAGFGVNFSEERSVYERNKPYIYSFMPDQETELEWSSAFICRKLVGGKARFSTDADLKTRDRKIGLVFEKSQPQDDLKADVAAEKLRAELKRQCNFAFAKEASYRPADTGQSSGDAAASIISQMKLDNVTTLVCYCLPGSPLLAMQNAASSANYHPEWYFDMESAMDRVIWQGIYWAKDQVNFGMTYFWRQPEFRQQYHYQAYLQEEPGSTPNMRFNSRFYWLFQNLFSGIQGAGPNLDAGWAERGMFSFKNRNMDNPWFPAGGYGPGGPSFYTFIETGEGWWRDPQGTPPGGKQGEGCMRVIQGGKRFSTNWATGDADMSEILARSQGRQPTDPCTDDIYKLEDPKPGDI